MLAVRTSDGVPQRSIFRLRARAVLFQGVQYLFRLGPLARRLSLQILCFPLEVAEAGALNRERLLQGKAGPVVADQPIRAFPQRVVGEVLLPLDDGCLIFQAGRCRDERLVDVGLRGARFERRRRWAAARRAAAPAKRLSWSRPRWRISTMRFIDQISGA
jgi:hypothetical protein